VASNGRAVPRVSIGLPVYNGERYVAEALDSLLAQEFTDFELLIGDNGSSDATPEICRAYAARDARVRYLSSEVNRGAAWNWNRVFSTSSGAYFRWAAHDDLVAPEHLARCVDALDYGGPGVVLAYTQTTLIDESGAAIGEYDDDLDASDGRAHVRVARIVRHVVLSNVLFGLVRREVMLKTRLHGAYPSADWALIVEWAMQGSFVQVPERLFLRRMHPGMSRLANRDPNSVAEFFEPGSGRAVRPEFLRLFGEQVKAIGRSPVGLTDRLQAGAVFVPVYLARHRRAMVKEAKALATRRLQRV
jgi:glycosyltransferase involved in cell wall biosynthesis